VDLKGEARDNVGYFSHILIGDLAEEVGTILRNVALQKAVET
jgi:hypothetical protein